MPCSAYLGDFLSVLIGPLWEAILIPFQKNKITAGRWNLARTWGKLNHLPAKVWGFGFASSELGGPPPPPRGPPQVFPYPQHPRRSGRWASSHPQDRFLLILIGEVY